MNDLPNDPVQLSVVKATVGLLLNRAFYGQIVSNLKTVILEDDSWCGTACTDGDTIYWNREFVKKHTKQELMFIAAHEILHVLYGHVGKLNRRDPDIFNMATDYLVNYTLVNDICAKSGKDSCAKIPDCGLYDARFTDEMTTEEIYQILKDSSVEIKAPLDFHILNPVNKKNDDEQDGDSSGDSDGDNEGDGDDEGNGGNSQEDGAGDGEGGSGNNGDKNGKSNGKITVLGRNGPPQLTARDLERIQQKIVGHAIQAAMAVGAGNVPAGVMRRIGELIEPKIDWRSKLDSFLRSSIRDDFTFQRLSRRDMGSFILPASDIVEKPKIHVAVDTSGSMSEQMLRDIFSEIKGIMETFEDFELSAWTFDTKVYGHKTFTPMNLSEMDDFVATAKGGGGTMFECNWDFMKREDISPDRLILFTDGYPCGTWGDEHYCDTLFVIHGNTKIVAPFGETCYYDAPEL